MSDIIPIQPDKLTRYDEGYLIPKEHVRKGVVVHVSGAPLDIKPMALVLYQEDNSGWFLTLCSQNGPAWALSMISVVDVKTTEFPGVTFPINTPAGIRQMVPPSAVGIEVMYILTPDMQGRLRLHTLTPRAAERWVSAIQAAKILSFNSQDQRGFE